MKGCGERTSSASDERRFLEDTVKEPQKVTVRVPSHPCATDSSFSLSDKSPADSQEGAAQLFRHLSAQTERMRLSRQLLFSMDRVEL